MVDPTQREDEGYDDAHDVSQHVESQQISPSGQITHADLVKGIDFEEDDFIDPSGGVRRDGQDHPSAESQRRTGLERGTAWDGKSGRVV